MPQRAEDALAGLLDPGGDVSIAGRLGIDKAWFVVLVGAIEIDPLEADAMASVATCVRAWRLC
jgi:hypothetical protein